MKILLSLVSAALLLAPGFCKVNDHKFITRPATSLGIDECTVCLDFAQKSLQVLLDSILQGVVSTCGDLCGDLEQKTGSQVLGVICDLACDVVGIKEFVDIIDKDDLDPIFYCEELKECPINDHGDAKFTQFEVMPKSGPQGEFDISFEYMSKNGTGTGQIVLEILTVDKIPLEQAFLHEIAPAGTYSGTFKLRAEPDPDCDPTQGPCEQWLPGAYTVKIAICNGECGSKHPHSQIYDEDTATFTITK